VKRPSGWSKPWRSLWVHSWARMVRPVANRPRTIGCRRLLPEAPRAHVLDPCFGAPVRGPARNTSSFARWVSTVTGGKFVPERYSTTRSSRPRRGWTTGSKGLRWRESVRRRGADGHRNDRNLLFRRGSGSLMARRTTHRYMRIWISSHRHENTDLGILCSILGRLAVDACRLDLRKTNSAPWLSWLHARGRIRISG